MTNAQADTKDQLGIHRRDFSAIRRRARGNKMAPVLLRMLADLTLSGGVTELSAQSSRAIVQCAMNSLGRPLLVPMCILCLSDANKRCYDDACGYLTRSSNLVATNGTSFPAAAAAAAAGCVALGRGLLP